MPIALVNSSVILEHCNQFNQCSELQSKLGIQVSLVKSRSLDLLLLIRECRQQILQPRTVTRCLDVLFLAGIERGLRKGSKANTSWYNIDYILDGMQVKVSNSDRSLQRIFPHRTRQGARLQQCVVGVCYSPVQRSVGTKAGIKGYGNCKSHHDRTTKTRALS